MYDVCGKLLNGIKSIMLPVYPVLESHEVRVSVSESIVLLNIYLYAVMKELKIGIIRRGEKHSLLKS